MKVSDLKWLSVWCRSSPLTSEVLTSMDPSLPRPCLPLLLPRPTLWRNLPPSLKLSLSQNLRLRPSPATTTAPTLWLNQSLSPAQRENLSPSRRAAATPSLAPSPPWSPLSPSPSFSNLPSSTNFSTSCPNAPTPCPYSKIPPPLPAIFTAPP